MTSLAPRGMGERAGAPFAGGGFACAAWVGSLGGRVDWADSDRPLLAVALGAAPVPGTTSVAFVSVPDSSSVRSSASEGRNASSSSVSRSAIFATSLKMSMGSIAPIAPSTSASSIEHALARSEAEMCAA